MTLLGMWSLKASAILGLALISLRFLRGRSAAARHCVLSVALVCALLVPLMTTVGPSLVVPAGLWSPEREAPVAPGSIQSAGVPQSAGGSLAERLDSSFPAAALPVEPRDTLGGQPPASPLRPQSVPSARFIDPGTWLMRLWVAGAGIGLIGLAVGAMRVARIASLADRVMDQAWLALANEVSRAYGLRRPVVLLRSRWPILATWGARRPRVLLPAASSHWSGERINVVLSHELAHVSRGDWIVQMLAEGMRAVHWFNPVVWTVCRRLQQESERACDDAVLGRGVTGTAYAGHLLDLARTLKVEGAVRLAPTLMMARASTLETRFKALLSPGVNRTRMTRTSVATIAAMCVVVLAPVSAVRITGRVEPAPAGEVVPPAPTRTSASVAIPSPGNDLTAASQQTPAGAGLTATQGDGSASLDGVVVTLGTNTPIAGVDVELSRIEGVKGFPLAPGAADAYAQTVATPRATGARPLDALTPEVRYGRTQADGRFVFRGLKPGTYRLVAVQVGGAFVPAEYGQRHPRGRGLAFPIAPGQAMKGARLEMALTGTISGRVLGTDGEPAGHLRVSALEHQYRNGQRVLSIVQSVHTNERGEYRLFWLPPGRYFVSARVDDLQQRLLPILVVPPGQAAFGDFAAAPVVTSRILPGGDVVEETTRAVWYGDALELEDATTIELSQGASVSGANIAMAVGKARAVHIRGVVTGDSAQSAAGVRVRAVQTRQGSDGFVIIGVTDARGAFDLAGVVPGRYALSATRSLTAPGTPIAYASIQVGEDGVDNLRLAANLILPLVGRVTIEGPSSDGHAANLARIRIAIARDPDVNGLLPPLAPPLPGEPANGVVDPNGRFTLKVFGSDAEHFRVSVSRIPTDTYVKAIRMGPQDVLAGGLRLGGSPDELEVVIGADAGAVTGVVVGNALRVLPNATVVLVPESAALQRRVDLYKTATADVMGQFRFTAVPPADYRILAFDFIEAGTWLDPQFLKTYPGLGTRVRVDPHARRDNVRVAVAPGRR